MHVYDLKVKGLQEFSSKDKQKKRSVEDRREWECERELRTSECLLTTNALCSSSNNCIFTPLSGTNDNPGHECTARIIVYTLGLSLCFFSATTGIGSACYHRNAIRGNVRLRLSIGSPHGDDTGKEVSQVLIMAFFTCHISWMESFLENCLIFFKPSLVLGRWYRS